MGHCPCTCLWPFLLDNPALAKGSQELTQLTPGQGRWITCRPLPPVPEVAPCRTATEGFLTMEVGRDIQGLSRSVN